MHVSLATIGILTLSMGIFGDTPPPALPSGMDLLYGTRIGIYQDQEPIVPVGIMDGQRRLVFSSDSPLQLDYYERGVLKTTQVSSNLIIKMTLGRVEAAEREHHVDLEGVAWGSPKALQATIDKWKERGLPTVRALEEGTLFGLGGVVIDNRAYRIVSPAKSVRAANRVIDKLFAKWSHRAQIRSRITERPWGELKLVVDGFQIATATSYIRITPSTSDSPTTVHQVEFGKGYKWAGRENRQYRGTLYAVVDPNGSLAAVNTVPVETILTGVVPSELFASAHPEALKAQAVAARTILFAQLGKRHYADPYHLCSSQHCQVYGGSSHEDPRATHAVNATGGELLFHNDRLINATYSSTCGGFTEDNDAVWRNHPSKALRGQPDFPANDGTLARFDQGITSENINEWLKLMPNSFCKKAPQSQKNKLRWSREFSGHELNALVKKHYPKLGPLTNMKVLTRGISGRAMSLKLIGTRGTSTVLYELPIRRLFGNLRSAAFVIEFERQGKRISKATFKGAGWGHGVGMCQLGAIGRAEANHPYKAILKHYYNGAKLRRLYQPTRAAHN